MYLNKLSWFITKISYEDEYEGQSVFPNLDNENLTRTWKTIRKPETLCGLSGINKGAVSRQAFLYLTTVPLNEFCDFNLCFEVSILLVQYVSPKIIITQKDS